jgi:hypothetical protein
VNELINWLGLIAFAVIIMAVFWASAIAIDKRT